MKTFAHSILIIDDDVLNIMSLTHLLSDEFNVFTERSGSSALQAAKDILPDVILLDVVMPDMNGFEVITALKEDDSTKDIPVIFVTGLNNTKDEEQGLILGAADYINKPFSSYIVKLRIRNQLKLSSQIRTILELSTIDPVTSFSLRKSFYSVIDVEWRRASRTNSSLGFAIFNIDNFSQYNEKHGHQKGDELLGYLARTILECTNRAADRIARWSDDEFAAVLYDTDLDGVKIIADAIHSLIESDAQSIKTNFFDQVTISTGVHSIRPELQSTYTIDDLILDTTTALAYAKKSGKNRVATFDDAKRG